MAEESSSILNDVKKLLGLGEDYIAFDTDVIILINSAFSKLTQLGVGPESGYSIADFNNKWDEFDCGEINSSFVKNYIFLSVKVTFDPPSSSYVQDAYNSQIAELEWRMMIEADNA